MEDLLKMIERATQPDRQIDRAVANAIGLPCEWAGGELLFFYSEDEGAPWGVVPDYSASVDAALALVERVLPGPRAVHWQVDVTDMLPPSGPADRRAVATVMIKNPPTPYSGGAPTPALAILAALLKALQGQPNS